MTIQRMIQTVGVGTFVKYYHQIKNYNSRLTPAFFEEDYTANTKQTKVNVGKKIFEEKLEMQVLYIIANSTNISNEFRALAFDLLGEEVERSK